jgi:hypothetical protein
LKNKLKIHMMKKGLRRRTYKIVPLIQHVVGLYRHKQKKFLF